MNRRFIGHFTIVVGAVMLALLIYQSALSQQETPAQGEKTPDKKTHNVTPAADKAPFSLKVKRDPILNISLKAEKVRLTEIADSLAKQLKASVKVAPALEQQLVSIEFDELTLEPAMQLLAPAAYIDYEIKTSHPESPRALGIFFYPANQEPPVTAVVPGSNQSLLIEGDTEDGVEPTTDEERRRQEEKPLRVQFKDNTLSIKSRKQSLQLVLLKVGEELGIPVEIQNDTSDLIDVDLNKVTVEEAMRQLSPDITLFLRVDLAHTERRALKLVLGTTEVTKPQDTKAATQDTKRPA